MKKSIIFMLAFFVIILVGVIIWAIYYYSYIPTEQIVEDEFSCIVDSDCVISENHPNPSLVYPCVNKEWQENWNKNPESQNYFLDCEIAACSGLDCPDISDKYCECIDNKCKKADISKYGWEWACD